MSIEYNLSKIRHNIEESCAKSGRNPSEITLIGVTKTIEAERIKRLTELGITQLGENKVQELNGKYPMLEGVDWHLIGHLQTNKVKYIIDKVKMIHSLDSLKLASEIDKYAKTNDKIMDVLVEINIANEQTKHGIKPEEISTFLQELSIYSNIMVKGLMCIAPNVEKSEENRYFFEKMRHLFIDNSGKTVNNINMQYLSMGMTNDYQVAIEEGSNIIRIGTGIFGDRE